MPRRTPGRRRFTTHGTPSTVTSLTERMAAACSPSSHARRPGGALWCSGGSFKPASPEQKQWR
ncbi:Uncharacterised protein [Bordetella pertussis]|nr:Uncharacterised protein [Bordetella pertussis]